LNIGLKSCNTGTNGPEKEPEYISLTVPGTRGNNNVLPPQPPSPQLPGFLRIGPNWRQTCNYYDSLIIEPCETLVTPDGYALTAAGLRVLACFAGGALALVHPELLQYSFLCGQRGGN
jgi:hypothetical protein